MWLIFFFKLGIFSQKNLDLQLDSANIALEHTDLIYKLAAPKNISNIANLKILQTFFGAKIFQIISVHFGTIFVESNCISRFFVKKYPIKKKKIGRIGV